VSKNFDSLRKVQFATRSSPWLAAIRQDSAEGAFGIRSKACVDPLELEARASEGLRRRTISLYGIGFVLGALLVSAGAIGLRHYERRMSDSQRAVAMASTAAKVPEISSPNSTVEQSATEPSNTDQPVDNQSNSALPATISLDLPGFVLQVAAMKHEENADALAETLRRRDFPVFVFKRGPGPFYRVAIGVYGDAGSAARVKDELEKQSFKANLIHWVPE
jgi:sporulation related protein